MQFLILKEFVATDNTLLMRPPRKRHIYQDRALGGHPERRDQISQVREMVTADSAHLLMKHVFISNTWQRVTTLNLTRNWRLW